jgi:protein ImuB
VPIEILEKAEISSLKSGHDIQTSDFRLQISSAVFAFKRWGIKTLGGLAALPPADLSARLGKDGLLWRAIARGEDTRPLVPEVPEERFESSIELDWPIEGLEPLSFVLTRLLEPLAMRLERRDRGAAVLHVVLRLVTSPSARSASAGAGHGELAEPCESHARRLELPAPIRDVRTLRTLALLDLESHPPPAAIEGVTVVIDPTPGRVLQHRLFTRAHPTPEQLSTLLARLGALMGGDRIGAPARVNSYRPGAFEMTPFKTEHDDATIARRDREENFMVKTLRAPRPPR